MFEPNPQSSCNISIGLRAFVVEQGSRSISNSFLVAKNLTDWRPLVWNLAMRMTVLWIVNIGIDTTFEDVPVRAGLRSRLAGRSRQMNVQKSGNVA